MKNKLIFLILISIFLVSLISAEITLEINVQDSFRLDEQMFFSYTLTSNIDTLIIFIPHIFCSNVPIAMLQEKTIELQANTAYTETYLDQFVQDWFEPQTCTAYVQIISPIQKIVSKNFSIIINPSFDFNLIFEKKVFLQNEEIYLDYESSIENVEIKAILKYPSNNQKEISLPVSIKAEQIGTYNLEIIAFKEGYKDVNVKEQFAVIKEEADISYSDVKKISSLTKSNLIYYLIGGAVLVILFIIYLTIRKKRRF